MNHDRVAGIEDLGEDECLRLLAAKSVGRVGFVGNTGPVILPVNFVLDAGTVLFRTAAYNTAASALRDAQAAFEVDEIDDHAHAGWSVLVQGTASYVDDLEELPH